VGGFLILRPRKPYHERMNEFERKAREMERERGKIPVPTFEGDGNDKKYEL
jgi:hypothetical protein